jgi:RNase P subunit RPR2
MGSPRHILTHVSTLPSKQINVYPHDHEKARAAVAATHTTAPKERVSSTLTYHVSACIRCMVLLLIAADQRVSS